MDYTGAAIFWVGFVIGTPLIGWTLERIAKHFNKRGRR